MKNISLDNMSINAQCAPSSVIAKEHLRVELEPGKSQTISVKLPTGKIVTFDFIPKEPNTDQEFECVEIHSDVGSAVPWESFEGGTPDHLLHFVGLTHGGVSFSTRRPGTKPCTLATLLLGSNHYQSTS